MKIALRLFAGLLLILSVSVFTAWAWDRSDDLQLDHEAAHPARQH